MNSTLQNIFTQVDEADGTIKLGKDIHTFVNALKLVHGYSRNLKATEQITESMLKVYKSFVDNIDELPFKSVADDYGKAFNYTITDSITVENIVKLPVKMPKICILKKIEDEQFEIQHFEFLNFKANPENANMFTYQVKKTLGNDSQNDYVNVVKEQLNILLDERNYKLATTNIQEMDQVSVENKKAFSSEIRDTLIYEYDISILDFILFFADKDIETVYNIPSQPPTDVNELEFYLHVQAIHDFLKTDHNYESDDMNSLIVDIIKSQKDITETKKNLNENRYKLHTFISRDKSYTKNLNAVKTKLIMLVVFLFITLVAMGLVISSKTLSLNNKTQIVLTISCTVLVLNIVYYLINIFKSNKESFTNEIESNYGFSSVEGSDTSSVNLNIALAFFVDLYSQRLSHEIKNEYYDSLSEHQRHDLQVLEQLNKEHNVKSHFHRLKNNLTHYKINEKTEYIKYIKYAIILFNILAILYLATMHKSISNQSFKYTSYITISIFVIYVMMGIKSMMLRDKYDWDRFHYSMKHVDKNNSQGCDLPGWGR